MTIAPDEILDINFREQSIIASESALITEALRSTINESTTTMVYTLTVPAQTSRILASLLSAWRSQGWTVTHDDVAHTLSFDGTASETALVANRTAILSA